jgi:hypothetical protein
LYKQVQMPMMDDRLLTFATDNGKLKATQSSECFAPELPLDIGPALPNAETCETVRCLLQLHRKVFEASPPLP